MRAHREVFPDLLADQPGRLRSEAALPVCWNFAWSFEVRAGESKPWKASKHKGLETEIHLQAGADVSDSRVIEDRARDPLPDVPSVQKFQ